ncbi:hypothetical protein [Pleurocapsa sp. PCC 7319]|uniref:hypothetical protein n=1 Tax=Pleurocapsa sp. PCC 7319 TaxID=118161 RepID=UPI00034A2183|nr:hypothetical protein [Pleurocapsa sp. PCC 7319]
MTESLITISNAPLPHPGMDYALLRDEGIKAIAQLAGNRWTDYNSHDPGITILEALCYAITDLSYRLDFAMEDLLAYPPSESDPPSLFLTARDILTVNPLTINDYRKILIDIDGIKNAWLEPIEIPQPELYYNATKASLSFSSLNLAEPVNLRGLYRVLLEKEPGYQDEDLVKAATEKLQKQRNLCEDFVEIRVLPLEEIIIKAEIEIGDGVNPHQLMAQLYTALEREISPTLEFLSLTELLNQGMPVEDIFAGPQLEHGFIDDEQLQKFQRQSELHTSDLIHLILDMPGVNAVKSITIASDRSPTPQLWALDLDPQLTPSLKSIKKAVESGDIKFYKGQINCPLDSVKVEGAKDAFLANSDKSLDVKTPQDIPIPRGDYRELADYVSIQNEFPLTYGIGDIGLPASATAERQAQAKQLQAYLMVFDQLLANYFAQLDRVKELFSFSNREIKTYFAQSIEHFPGAKTILKNSYGEYLQQSAISEAEELERKNRFLDHLIAQYGETFTDYSLLYPDSDLSTEIVQHKVDFALDYPQVSAGRNQAFNYTLDPNKIENFHNVSGLKRRIARLLGIEPDRQFLASSDDTEGFYLVEHILLRPRLEDVPAPDSEQSQDFLSFSHPITEFKASDNTSYVTCTSENHGLKKGDRLDIFYSIYYNGTYSITNIKADTFDIDRQFISGETKDTGAWVRSDQFPDPFSFQISVILPNWSGRFSNPSFQQLAISTLIAETPAHITLHLHWFERAKMQDFETTYAIWLQQLASDSSTDTIPSADYTSRLITLLELGSSMIQQPPALLGYMTIVENDQDRVENPFIVL